MINTMVGLRNLCEHSEAVNTQLTDEVHLMAIYELLKSPSLVLEATQLLLVISDNNPAFARLMRTSPHLVNHTLSLLPEPTPEGKVSHGPLAAVAAAGVLLNALPSVIRPDSPEAVLLNRCLDCLCLALTTDPFELVRGCVGTLARGLHNTWREVSYFDYIIITLSPV
jgi:hypothetical protein